MFFTCLRVSIYFAKVDYCFFCPLRAPDENKELIKALKWPQVHKINAGHSLKVAFISKYLDNP